jgi:23S rRNA maturation-related 3'-5' exoribonuclease YhaM
LTKIIKVFFAKDKILYVCGMLIKKEQQEAMIEIYAKTHTTAEVVGFIDGLQAMLNLIERLDKNRK